MKAGDVKTELRRFIDPKAAEFAQRFFKTYDGGYAAGDKFLGLRVPLIRQVAKKYKDLPLDEVEKLLASPVHEDRQTGLIIITDRAKKASPAGRKELYDFYLSHLSSVNNWDLVDLSCPWLIGEHLIDKKRAVLYRLARSKSLWEKRIAMVSTLNLIRAGQLDDTFAIAEILMDDPHDLIHKAVGWMLRCAGDKDRGALLKFLDEYAGVMPRTALRYALEHLMPKQKTHYMSLQSKTGVK